MKLKEKKLRKEVEKKYGMYAIPNLQEIFQRSIQQLEKREYPSNTLDVSVEMDFFKLMSLEIKNCIVNSNENKKELINLVEDKYKYLWPRVYRQLVNRENKEISMEEVEVLYLEAIEKGIEEYEGEQLFSIFIQSILVRKCKKYVEKSEEKKMEKYISSYLERKVEPELLNAIIDGLYPKDKKILRKAFGFFYNQNMYSQPRLEYNEKVSLDMAMKRINSYLDFCEDVYSQTQKYKNVSLALAEKLGIALSKGKKEKNSKGISPSITSPVKEEKKKVISSPKATVKKAPKNPSLNKKISFEYYEKKYKISREEIEKIIEGYKEEKDFLLYAYYYGITRPKLSIDQIYSMLKLKDMGEFLFNTKISSIAMKIEQELGQKSLELKMTLKQQKQKKPKENSTSGKKSKGNSTRGKKPKGYLEFFEEKDRDIVLMIIKQMKETHPEYYEAIHKIYKGDNLDVREQDGTILKQDKVKAKNAKLIIKRALSRLLEKNNPTEEDILEALKEKARSCRTNIQSFSKGFLEYFKEEDRDTVLLIIEQMQGNHDTYYQVIHKFYSGDKLEKTHLGQTTSKERANLSNAKTFIKNILNKLENKKNINREIIQIAILNRGSSKGYLEYFEEKDRDTVLLIIKQMKERYPNYYQLIHKVYSGERLEERNQVANISDKEKTSLNDSKRLIRRILGKLPEKEVIVETDVQKVMFRKKMGNRAKGYLEYFEEIDSNTILLIIEVMRESHPEYYKSIHKLYSGEKLEVKNQEEDITKEDKVNVNNAKTVIKRTLDRLSEKEIDSKEDMKLEIRKVIGKSNHQKCGIGFLEYFKEEDRDTVLLIIEQMQGNHDTYYQVIHKFYSGERLETKNVIKMEINERVNLNNAKICIKKVISKLGDQKDVTDETIQKILLRKNTKGYLDYFEEKDRNTVLLIIEVMKERYPDYYQLIHKAYSGEKLDTINDEDFIKVEKNRINYTKTVISRVLEYVSSLDNVTKEDILARMRREAKNKPKENKEKDSKTTEKKEKNFKIAEEKENDFQKYLEHQNLTPLENAVLILKHRNYSVDEIAKIINVDVDTIYMIIIEHLDLFENNIHIIFDMITSYQKGIYLFINSNYYKRLAQDLTTQEQTILLLKLETLHNPLLTNEKIAELVGIPYDEVKNYTIMSKNDLLNELNKIIKKVL